MEDKGTYPKEVTVQGLNLSICIKTTENIKSEDLLKIALKHIKKLSKIPNI